MKRLIIAATLLLASMGVANAQRPVIKVDANLGFSDIIIKTRNITIDTDLIIGYRVGAGVEFNLGSNGLFINPGIVFTSKGGRSTVMDEKDLTNKILRFHYFQVPVHIGYHVNFAEKMGVSFQTGPFFGVGITGKGTDFDENIFSMEGSNRFDLGLGIQAAFHYDRFYAQVGYEQGFLSFISEGVLSDEFISFRNNNFFMGVGVRF